jgi:hypothetical protein
VNGSLFLGPHFPGVSSSPYEERNSGGYCRLVGRHRGLTVGLHFAAIEASLAEEATIEFAPGLRRRVMLGTPPPPPPVDLYAVRLGLIGNRPRRNLLTPLVTVLLVVTAIAVGLNVRVRPGAGPRGRHPAPATAPVAATTARRHRPPRPTRAPPTRSTRPRGRRT